MKCSLKKGKISMQYQLVFSKIQTPTQDLVPDTNLKICCKFGKFDTITLPRASASYTRASASYTRASASYTRASASYTGRLLLTQGVCFLHRASASYTGRLLLTQSVHYLHRASTIYTGHPLFGPFSCDVYDIRTPLFD